MLDQVVKAWSGAQNTSLSEWLKLKTLKSLLQEDYLGTAKNIFMSPIINQSGSVSGSISFSNLIDLLDAS